MPLASFRTEHTAAALIVHVTGEVDLSNAEEIQRHAKEVRAAAEPAPEVTCINLTDVTFFDSAGINALFDLNNQLTAAGNVLQVVAPPQSRARLVLDVVQLDQVATVTDTLANEG